MLEGWEDGREYRGIGVAKKRLLVIMHGKFF